MSNYFRKGDTRDYSRRVYSDAKEWQAGDFKEQLAGSRELVQSYPRGGYRSRNFQRGGARDQYNKKKTETKRVRENFKTQANLSVSLDKKIGAGLDDLTEALNKMEANRTLVAITTIITTRGISFTAAQIYYQAAGKRNPTYASIYCLFRVNLALMEAKLATVRTIAAAPFQPGIATNNVRIDPKLFQVVNTLKAMPDLSKRILDICGPIDNGNEYFVPAFPATRRDANQVLVVLPGEVHYSNLREVVECLSNRQYSRELRRNFYERNPIPGTIWYGAPNDPVLENPNDIMPANFTMDNLQTDVMQVNRMMSWMQSKLEKFVSVGTLDLNRKGDVSALISNAEENLRYPDLQRGEQLEQYYNRLILEGNIEDYWSSRGMTKTEELIGQLALVGEVPSIANYVYPDYTLHSRVIAGHTYDSNYNGMKEILYG